MKILGFGYKGIKRWEWGLTILGLLLLNGFINVCAQDGEALFKANCAACHNIEGTPLMGPNLKNITQTRQNDWIKQFIVDSRKMYDRGDVEARAIIDEYKGMQMPAFNFSDSELEALISYINAQSGTISSMSTDTLSAKKDTGIALKDEREQIIYGFELFTGKIAFRNKGSACIACHNVAFEGFNRGGTLAKDLTHVYSRMSKNDAALRGVINGMPFSAMAAAYVQHPLTKEEIESLVVFLRHADTSPQQAALSHDLLVIGILAGCLLVILLSILYRRGKIQSVNYRIHSRQHRTNE